MDRLTPEERSRHMKKIKGKDTKPEMIVRKFLHANGFRFRLHDKSLPGRPDIKLSKYKTAIFIHGCFWHGHQDCHIYQMPKTRIEFWKNKIDNNIVRDKRNLEALEQAGWKVIVIWECQLKATKRTIELQSLINTLRGE
jgi:DNA mismatch endonuclease (patch repair protein)